LKTFLLKISGEISQDCLKEMARRIQKVGQAYHTNPYDCQISKIGSSGRGDLRALTYQRHWRIVQAFKGQIDEFK
jgi:hypothetical protein